MANRQQYDPQVLAKHPSLDAPAVGSDNPVTSGVVMNRSNETSPEDPEQDRRLQARQESEWAAGLRANHPDNVRANLHLSK